MKSSAWTAQQPAPSLRGESPPVRHDAGRFHRENAVKTAIRSTIAAALVLIVSTAASAHCIIGGGPDRGAVKALTRSNSAYAAAPAAAAPPAASDNASIVGLWTVTFFVGDGPDVWDVGFEQFHADGTEFTMDVAVPPSAGNVCVGVWERVSGHHARLHHVGWNWDTSVTPAALAGVFVLDMTLDLERGGKAFSGHYVTDSYDNDGNVIPAFHAEGAVTATRISVDSKKW